MIPIVDIRSLLIRLLLHVVCFGCSDQRRRAEEQRKSNCEGWKNRSRSEAVERRWRSQVVKNAAGVPAPVVLG